MCAHRVLELFSRSTRGNNNTNSLESSVGGEPQTKPSRKYSMLGAAKLSYTMVHSHSVVVASRCKKECDTIRAVVQRCVQIRSGAVQPDIRRDKRCRCVRPMIVTVREYAAQDRGVMGR